MPISKSKSKRSKVEKVENWKKPEDKGGDGWMTTPLSPHRLEKHSKYGHRLIRRDGSLDRPSAKRLLEMGNMNVKQQKTIVRGKRIRSKSSNRGKTVRRYGPNPDYTPSPKKKSCCERWFRWGSKKRNKKCKKKCKTRKKKNKTRKKKRRRRKR